MDKLLVQEARSSLGALATLGFILVRRARSGALEGGDALLDHGFVSKDLAGDYVEAITVVVDDLITMLVVLERSGV